MKYITKLLMILAASLFVATSCISEEVPYSDDSTQDDNNAEKIGYLEFINFSLEVDIDGEIVSKADEAVDVDDFIVSICSAESGAEVYSSTYKEVQELSEPISLEVGNYQIFISSVAAEDEPLCGWDVPYYTCTKDIVIEVGETSEVADCVCTLSNIKTSLSLSADFTDKFQDDATAEIPLEITVKLDDAALVYSRTESRCGYFKAIEASNTLIVSISGMYNTAASGETPSYVKIENWEQEITDVAAGQWRKISIRTETDTNGNVSFSMSVETWVYDEIIDVDIMEDEVTEDGITEPEEDDDNDQTTGSLSIEWRDGYDFDTRYDITPSTDLPVVLDINSETGITSFLVRIDSEVLTAADLVSMNLDTEMDLINPATDLMAAALADLGFPVGDEVEGATYLLFDITSFMPLLAMLGEGDTTFELEVSDASGTVIRQIKLSSVSE
ncbi:MAG: DUF4493 domain-containing protein [Rikenellaceae bacterium]